MATELTVSVPANAADLATDQRKAEALAESLSGLVIDDAEAYTAADEMLSEIARRKAAVLEMRKSATGPLYGVIRTVEAWFRPLVTALETCERGLKIPMGHYRVELEKREREARELAAQAAESNDAGGLVEALTVASEAAAKPDARATTRFMWRVVSLSEENIPRKYMCADMKAIEAFARAHKGDEPPVIPGVTFERVAQIGARK